MQWILVTDQFPNNSQDVLVCAVWRNGETKELMYHTVETARFQLHNGKPEFVDITSEDLDAFEVSHWAALPALPEGLEGAHGQTPTEDE